MSKITVILADDHTLVRKGIKAMLESDEEIAVVAEAENGLQALEKSREFHPALLVMDIRMPLMTGLEACGLLPDYAPGTKVLILSMHDSEDYVLQSLKAGAWGYLLKDIDRNEFIKALKQVHAGNKYFSGAVSNILANQLLRTPGTARAEEPKEDPYGLTRREKEILRLVINGNQNKQIAESLGKSVRTVETHRFNIMKKLGVNNAVDMVNKVVKEQLV
ncbi:LuxR family two component transcriptional regulator [Anseongella ginsenosidimutans]|uniref:LuxR family two component transcriptional regulator n=1 Tax=Anseongella ginsenosidimutans TaxID=496056 RepID=A0A4R3KYN3_9SPHI|nr:response regulator transcription factor [Anseongella ginsenosidimutans]QEC51174.1 response regulator transcription factor [Anseongella ginsenosidimutans]TCS90156.1 LuxR family two component transcriptional regulator [Anseongella ginsenosidimutans]